MKTAIKTLFATALTAIVLTSSAFATFAQDGTKKTSGLPAFSMIQIKGNVKLHLRQGFKESIRVETANTNDDVTVEAVGQKLFIDSKEFIPADVYVTVKDLKRIDASGQTVVSTNGILNSEVLQIFLQDDASASVKVNSLDLYTVIKGNSNLKLAGTSAQHVSIKDRGSKLNTANFAALKTKTSESIFTAVDLDAQFAESLNINAVALNHIK